MSAPDRRRPGGSSPIRLVPEVEEVHTPSALAQLPTAEPAPTIEAETQASAPVTLTAAPEPPMDLPVTPVAAAVAPDPEENDEKKAVTFGMRTSLKKRAETAVLRTAGYEGGYQSMAALVEGALERELIRLANEFNDGVPYPKNTGGFRQGRPLGS